MGTVEEVIDKVKSDLNHLDTVGTFIGLIDTTYLDDTTDYDLLIGELNGLLEILNNLEAGFFHLFCFDFCIPL
jgi:hypothetical protein